MSIWQRWFSRHGSRRPIHFSMRFGRRSALNRFITFAGR